MSELRRWSWMSGKSRWLKCVRQNTVKERASVRGRERKQQREEWGDGWGEGEREGRRKGEREKGEGEGELRRSAMGYSSESGAEYWSVHAHEGNCQRQEYPSAR